MFSSVFINFASCNGRFSAIFKCCADFERASEKAWQEYTKSKESLILQIFYGLQRQLVIQRLGILKKRKSEKAMLLFLRFT
jgi:hypothetical protein